MATYNDPMLRLPVLVLTLWATSAAAQAVAVISGHGQRIAPLGNVPVERRDAVRQLTPFNGVQVGFVYRFDSIYGVDTFTRDGEFCLYMDSQYAPISRAQAAEFLGVSDVSPPWSYTVPPMWIALGVAATFALWLSVFGKRYVAYMEQRFPKQKGPL